MFIIYDIAFLIFAILYFPYLIIRGKWHSGFKMRFDVLPSGRMDERGRIWIHAVSVGEVLAIVDIVHKLKERYPKYTIVCSTVTKTGNQLAQELLGNECAVIYAPLDFSWIVRKFIRIIKPEMYIAAETEIWPNLYSALRKNGVPIVQINGRISDGSFKGYRRVRFLMRRILRCVDKFCMQSPLDAERILQLGAAPEKVHVVGNLKFDIPPGVAGLKKEELGFNPDDDVLIAGSTHPGEEELLLNIYQTLRKELPQLRLVIGPRHIERADAVMKLVEGKGYQAVRFSEIPVTQGNVHGVVVVDTIGHLRELYSLATVVFIGKSFAVGGGQNMIEPASAGKPVIVGPMTQNFKDAMAIFLKAGGDHSG